MIFRTLSLSALCAFCLVLAGCGSEPKPVSSEPSCTRVCRATYYQVCGINNVCLRSYTPTPNKDNCFTKEYREEGAVERICGTYSVEPQMKCDCVPTSETIAPAGWDSPSAE